MTLSAEAKDLFRNSTQKNVSEEVTNWYNTYMTVEGQVAPYPDIASWLPENQERLYALWDAQTAIAKAYPDPTTRPQEVNEKSMANSRAIAILETFGDSRVVTDEVMQEGLEVYHKAETKLLAMQNDPTNISLTKIAFEQFGDPEELEEKLEEWQVQQVTQNNNVCTDSEKVDAAENSLRQDELQQNTVNENAAEKNGKSISSNDMGNEIENWLELQRMRSQRGNNAQAL